MRRALSDLQTMMMPESPISTELSPFACSVIFRGVGVCVMVSLFLPRGGLAVARGNANFAAGGRENPDNVAARVTLS